MNLIQLSNDETRQDALIEQFGIVSGCQMHLVHRRLQQEAAHGTVCHKIQLIARIIRFLLRIDGLNVIPTHAI